MKHLHFPTATFGKNKGGNIFEHRQGRAFGFYYVGRALFHLALLSFCCTYLNISILINEKWYNVTIGPRDLAFVFPLLNRRKHQDPREKTR
jgi:hypothetical protein